MGEEGVLKMLHWGDWGDGRTTLNTPIAIK